jgi:MFS family permease
MLSYTRFTSRTATNAINFALILLIVDQTGKAFMSALLVLTLVVPGTVAGLAAGAVADSFPKRPIIFLANMLRAGVCLLFVLQGGGVAVFFMVAIVMATITQFASSAEGALMPAVVARGDLARANAIGHAVAGTAQILGFVVLTPIALRLFDSPRILFAACAALYLFAAFPALLIGRHSNAARLELGGRSRSPWYSAGWHEMLRDPRILNAAIELTLIATAMIILGGLIPIYIKDTLGLPVEIGAIVLMPAALGVVLGLRLANYMAHRVPTATLSTTGFALFVVLLSLLTFVDKEAEFVAGYGAFSWIGAVQLGSFDGAGVLAMFFVMPLGFSYALVAVAGQTVLNDLVPLHLQGRVLATQGALAAMASSVPVLVAGALTDVIGVTAVMAMVAVAIGVAAVANLRAPGRRRSTPEIVQRVKSH